MHITYLDSFGELEELLQTYQAAYRALRKTQRELEALQTDEGEKARLSDLLHYQIDEIEAANVQVVTEMVNMIEVQRQFEAYQKVMQSSDSLDRAANEKIGRRQG